eukprot:6201388-Pleurochrysis_carterae.AAC.1
MLLSRFTVARASARVCARVFASAQTAFRTYRAYKKDSKSLKQDKSSDTGEKKADAEAEATPKQTSTRGPPAGAEGKPNAQGEGHSEATADGESKGEGGGDSKGEGKDEGEGKENGASNSKETREGDAKGAKKGAAVHAEPGEQARRREWRRRRGWSLHSLAHAGVVAMHD